MDAIWNRIIKFEGQTFYTKTGRPFSYRVKNESIVLNNTNRTIARKQIEEASLVGSDTVTAYQQFQGPSYIYGLLHDSRIM